MESWPPGAAGAVLLVDGWTERFWAWGSPSSQFRSALCLSNLNQNQQGHLSSTPLYHVLPKTPIWISCTTWWVRAQTLNLWWKINFSLYSQQNWLVRCSLCPPARSPSSILFSLSHISCRHLIWLECWRQTHLLQFQTVNSISSCISTHISKQKRLLNLITLLKTRVDFWKVYLICFTRFYKGLYTAFKLLLFTFNKLFMSYSQVHNQYCSPICSETLTSANYSSPLTG